MTQLLRSSLAFIDSDYSVNGEADNFAIDIPANQINCADRQFIRLILQEFHGYKNFYNINTTNNTLRVKINASSFADVVIAPGNYETYNEIVSALGDALITALATLGATYTKNTATITPGTNVIPSSTSDRIMNLDLVYGSGTTITTMVLQAREIENTYDANSFSDSFALLGGRKVNSSADTSSSSFNITVGGGGDVNIKSYYPMQRSTCEHLYLRTSLVNNNLGSKSTHTGGNHGQDLSGTNILAKIPVQSEFLGYSSDSGTGYFVDIPLRNLTHIQFTITDHKGRRLPEVAPLQNTLGNMNYNFVVRIDIVQYGPSPQPNELLVPKLAEPKSSSTPYLQQGAPQRRRVPF